LTSVPPWQLRVERGGANLAWFFKLTRPLAVQPLSDPL
jgi:hypothetical protein